MKKKVMAALLAGVVLASAFAGCSKASGGVKTQPAKDTTYTANNDVLYHSYYTTPYITLEPSLEYSNGIATLQNVYET